MSTGRAARVLVVLDDAAAGEAVLGVSSALARALERELVVVFVESAASVSAAALPVTQVLPHAASPWLPLRPDDVEQGFRSHARRVRQQAERAAARHALTWSMQVMRGSLADAADRFGGDASLLFLASAPPPGATLARTSRRLRVAVVTSEGLATDEAMDAAVRLARVLDGVVQAFPLQSAGAQLRSSRPDVVVVSRRVASRQQLALLHCPLLLVG